MNSVADDCEHIDILANDFLARYRDGECPTVEEYARRHPEYSDSIRQMFPLVASIERIKINEQVTVDGEATLAGRALSQLGDFRIVREVGRGGMGIVFEAHQESLDRTVAIKVLPKQSLLDEQALERFRREAMTAASMHHSNIVPVYGTGEHEGSHYLVMQMVEGQSLDSTIAGGKKMACVEAASIAREVADAIAYSHANGVLHRDIKPANILIESDGTALVTDFGLAKSVGDALTNTHQVSGSLRYVAPERFAGISNELCDVYAIGLTLYELLAGRPAFEESDAEHLIGSITQSRRPTITSVCPDVPVDLATIVEKAIRVDPEQRYRSAADLRDDLGRFLDDEPILARRISSWGRLVRWARRNPTIATSTSIAAIALILATIVSTVAYGMTSTANQRTIRALASSEQTVDLALQSLNGVVDVVSGSPPEARFSLGDSFDVDSLPDVGLEPSPLAAKILERLQPTYERLSQQSPRRPDILLRKVDAGIQLARIQHALGQTGDGIQTLQSGIALLQERGVSGLLPIEASRLRLARLNNELGGLYAAEFEREASAACFESAIETAVELEPSSNAAQIELARAHLNAGSRPPNLRRTETLTDEDRVSDLAHVDAAIRILERLQTTSDESNTVCILLARSELAKSRLALDPTTRDRHFSAAVTRLRSGLATSPEDSNVRLELVTTLADVKIRDIRSRVLIAEASRRLEEALVETSRLRSGSPDNTLFLVSEVHLRHKLAAIARTQSRFGDAESMLNEAVQLQSRLVQTWPSSIRHRCWRAMLYRSLAAMYNEWGKLEQARATIRLAKVDVDTVGEEFSEHPLFERTRDAVGRLTIE
ncbi:MAG: serine/threonine-protein kinase [Planctomycetota bacterium]